MSRTRWGARRRAALAMLAGIALVMTQVPSAGAHVPHKNHLDRRYVNEDQQAGGELSGTFSNLTIDKPPLDARYVNEDQQAGGELSGTFSNLTIDKPPLDARYVNEDQEAGGEVTGTFSNLNVDESKLGQVPIAALGGLGRHARDGSCSPAGTSLIPCMVMDVPIPGPSRALVLAGGEMFEQAGTESGLGSCETQVVVGTTPIFVSAVALAAPASGSEYWSLAGVTGPLDPGTTQFRIACNEGQGQVLYRQLEIAVVALSAS